jgi:hypothetical protein
MADIELYALGRRICNDAPGSRSFGELDDYELRTGSNANANAGWITVKFDTPMTGTPCVIMQAQGSSLAIPLYQNITPTGFDYMMVNPAGE